LVLPALGLWTLLGSAALATPGPWSDAPLDPAARLIDRQGRAQGSDLLYGARHVGVLGMVDRLGRIDDRSGVLSTVLAPELSGRSAPDQLQWAVRHGFRVAAGELEPALQGGDVESGWGSLRAGSEGWGAWGPGVFYIRPELGLDARAGGEMEPLVGVREAWVGIHTEAWQAGFGWMDRWNGPGHHGGLMLTDNATPAPLGSVAWEGRLAEKWGRVRVEMGAGWLADERRDVQNPGWLFADFRWAPIPQFEMGATRVGIFGGEGRPAPEIGQLILPTKPHIEGDPEQLLPDQDEMAALDGRLTLPFEQWVGAGPEYLELYIQYGGEDVIAREIIGIPVPALAGVANLYGVAVGMGPLTADLEHARILDDRFRWYTGHRVYHQGFTQSGRSIAHPEGGDSISTAGSLGWFPGSWGVEASAARVLRVGIAAVEGDNVQALMADTSIDRVGLRSWWLVEGKRWLNAGLTVQRTSNPDYLPGPSDWAWRLTIGN